MKLKLVGFGVYGFTLFLSGDAASAQTEETIQLGTTQLLGREVPIVIPKSEGIIDRLQLKPEQKNILTHDGWKYLVVDGQPVMRFVEKGGWSDVPALYQEAQKRIAQGGSVEWKVKCFILSRVEILDVGVDGIARLRRGSLSKKDQGRVLEQLATLKALIEAGTKGHLHVKLDVEIDDSPVRTTLFPGGDTQRHIPAYLAGREETKQKVNAKDEYGIPRKAFDEFVEGRLNKEPFDADDRVDRGPFDAVFLLHPGLFRYSSSMTENPSFSSLSVFTNPRAELPYGLCLDLFDHWIGSLHQNAFKNGFLTPGNLGYVSRFFDYVDDHHPQWEALYRIATGIKWQNLSLQKKPSEPELLARTWPQNEIAAMSWDEAKIEPLSKLPMPRVSEMSGKDYFPLRTEPSQDGKSQVAIDLAFVDMVMAQVKPGVNMIAQKASCSAKMWAHFLLLNPTTNASPIFLNGLKAWSGEKDFHVTWNLKASKLPATTGYAKFEKTNDPEKGEVLVLVEPEATRWGSVRLFEGPLPPDVTGVKFWFKANSTDPVSTFLKMGSAGEYSMRGEILLSHVDLRPSAQPTRENIHPSIGVLLDPDRSNWREVQIPIYDYQREQIVEIRLGVSWSGACFERSLLEPSRFMVAGLTFLKDGRNIELTGIQPKPQLESSKQLWSWAFEPSEQSKKLILEALKSPSDPLHLSALVALAYGQPIPEAEPTLIALSKGGSGFAAELAIRSLAKIDTLEARNFIKSAAEKGPSEANRRAAATYWPESLTDLRSVPVLSSLLTSRDWRARKAAAESLSRIKTKEAAILLLTFLQDADPAVRLAVLRGANLELEIVNQRVLYYAVNDPFEWIRAAGYERLLDSPLPEYRKEGLKGVRNESLTVRLALVQKMSSKTMPEYREAIRFAVTAPESVLRIAALRALMNQPGEVQLAEIQNILQEKHPGVQLALLELTKAKKLLLPAPTISRLKASPVKSVADKAKEIWP